MFAQILPQTCHRANLLVDFDETGGDKRGVWHGCKRWLMNKFATGHMLPVQGCEEAQIAHGLPVSGAQRAVSGLTRLPDNRLVVAGG